MKSEGKAKLVGATPSRSTNITDRTKESLGIKTNTLLLLPLTQEQRTQGGGNSAQN